MYVRGARSNWSDGGNFPTLAEQDRADRDAMAELPPVVDFIVWNDDEIPTDADWADWLEFTYDPDDAYGTERY